MLSSVGVASFTNIKPGNVMLVSPLEAKGGMTEVKRIAYYHSTYGGSVREHQDKAARWR